MYVIWASRTLRATGGRSARPLVYCFVCAISACGPAVETEPEPVFPADLSGWTEGRACGFSHEHDLRYIRVLVNDKAREPYKALDAAVPYPVGAALVKLEYDDEDCGTVVAYTAMEKQLAGYSAPGHDWRWQRLTADRKVLDDGEVKTCITCHEHHCTEPQCGYADCGFDLTCAQED